MFYLAATQAHGTGTSGWVLFLIGVIIGVFATLMIIHRGN